MADGPDPTVLLGTVAIEPNRWATVDPSGAPTTVLSSWLDAAASAGFDGLEVWERHLTDATETEAEGVLDHGLPVSVFNTYASLDGDDATDRIAAAEWVRRSGATGVKFNVGNDLAQRDDYGRRIADWLEQMPGDVRLLCECHDGISIAEDPEVAASILEAGGEPHRVQAILHTHDDNDLTRARFAAYGDRITHVHVNYLDATPHPPRLVEVRPRLEARVALLRELGFHGSWTIEFVQGTLSENDHPDHLIEQAAADLAVLRDLLD